MHTLAEIYGIPHDEAVADVDWLAMAGTEQWPVLMKDERIRYTVAERDALVEFGVRAFCLTQENLRAAVMAEVFLAARAQMAAACREPGPFLYAVSRGAMRRVDLAG